MVYNSIVVFLGVLVLNFSSFAQNIVEDDCVGREPDCTSDFRDAQILNIEFDIDKKYASFAQYNPGADEYDVYFAQWDNQRSRFGKRVKLTYQNCNGANCGFTDSLVGMPQLGVFKKGRTANTVFVTYKNKSNKIIVCDLVKSDFYNPKCKKISPNINMNEFQFPFPIRDKNATQRYLAYRIATKHSSNGLAKEQLWGVDLDSTWKPSLIYEEYKPFSPAGCARGNDTSRCKQPLYTALNRTWWRWQDNTKKLFYGRRNNSMDIGNIDASYPEMSANLAIADFSNFNNWASKSVFDPSYDVIDIKPYVDKNGKNSVVIGKSYQDGLAAIIKDSNGNGLYSWVENFGYKSSNPETTIEEGNDFGGQSYEHFQMKDKKGKVHDYITYVVGDKSTTINGRASTNPSATGVWSEIWLHRVGRSKDCVISTPQDPNDRYVQTEPEVVVKKVGDEDKFFIYYNVGDPVSGFGGAFANYIRRIQLTTSISDFNNQCDKRDIWN